MFYNLWSGGCGRLPSSSDAKCSLVVVSWPICLLNHEFFLFKGWTYGVSSVIPTMFSSSPILVSSHRLPSFWVSLSSFFSHVLPITKRYHSGKHPLSFPTTKAVHLILQFCPLCAIFKECGKSSSQSVAWVTSL